MGLWHAHGPPNLGQKTRFNNNQQKTRTCEIVDFAVPANHRIKLKECEKKDKYLNLARDLKKLWNMQVTIIPIVIGVFETITKELLKELEDLEVGGQMETIQTAALLRMARIMRRVLETCWHSDSSEKPSANADVKISNEWIIIIINWWNLIWKNQDMVMKRKSSKKNWTSFNNST